MKLSGKTYNNNNNNNISPFLYSALSKYEIPPKALELLLAPAAGHWR